MLRTYLKPVQICRRFSNLKTVSQDSSGLKTEPTHVTSTLVKEQYTSPQYELSRKNPPYPLYRFDPANEFEHPKWAYTNSVAEDAFSWPQTKVTSLPSGLRIATETTPWNDRTASVGVFIDAGSRYETAENSGTAHFLEHLAFKGTNKRTREELEREVEDIGGHLNAYTSREQTVYFAQVLKNDTEQALDILSDILLDSVYNPDAIERERSVILQEMENVYKDTKEELVFDHLHENCFQDCALGRTILGPVENIKRINRDDIKRYVETNYTADRMVIVGTGAIDHEQFVQLVTSKFGQVLPANQIQGADMVKDESFFRGCEYEERWDEMPFAHVALAYETCPWNDPDSYPLMFMQQFLGQWDKKLPGGKYQPQWLTRKLYENDARPIAENYMAFNTPYTDIGLFGVYGTIHPYDLNHFLKLSRRAMNRLGSDVSESEVEDVREKLKATMLLNLSNTPQIMEEIGRQILVHGRRIHPSEAFARVNDVDVNAIRIAAQKYLIDRDHAIAGVGSTFEFPDYMLLRTYSYKLY